MDMRGEGTGERVAFLFFPSPFPLFAHGSTDRDGRRPLGDFLYSSLEMVGAEVRRSFFFPLFGPFSLSFSSSSRC